MTDNKDQTSTTAAGSCVGDSMKSIPSLVHQIVIGLGGNGFRADCTCGWHSHTSWVRDEIARIRDDHKRQSRLQEVP